MASTGGVAAQEAGAVQLLQLKADMSRMAVNDQVSDVGQADIGVAFQPDTRLEVLEDKIMADVNAKNKRLTEHFELRFSQDMDAKNEVLSEAILDGLKTFRDSFKQKMMGAQAELLAVAQEKIDILSSVVIAIAESEAKKELEIRLTNRINDLEKTLVEAIDGLTIAVPKKQVKKKPSMERGHADEPIPAFLLED
ncbi:hypothetical protein SLS62_003363 [Diatrype stigma]|uniref:Uncharacterized protein n=1 Tax=Diatrype stigma TaxID=117547 RepID=A0AAN9YUN3_9PEZI